MRSNRRYTAQFKAEAITRLLAAGYPKQRGVLGKVAQALDIPDATLYEWFKHPMKATRQPHRNQRTLNLVGHQRDAGELEEGSKRTDVTDNGAADTLTLFRQEMAHIHGELEAARAAASYKDLIMAWRGLNEDVRKLEAGNHEAPLDAESARTTFLEMLNQVADMPEDAEKKDVS